MLVEYLTAFDVLISGALVVLSGLTLRNHLALSRMKTERIELENRLGTIQQQTCFDGVLMQRAKRDGRGCVRFGTCVPSRGKTKDAVPLEVNAERAERSAA